MVKMNFEESEKYDKRFFLAVPVMLAQFSNLLMRVARLQINLEGLK